MNETNSIGKMKLNIEEYSNGIILPRVEVKNGPMWGLGGVCDENNQFIQSSLYDGGWATHGGIYPWEQEENVDADAVYIGMYYQHWGHFLIDLTNRFWALPKLCKENPNIKVAYLGEEEPKGNNLRFFELLGVKPNQLYHITEPTRFRSVYVPQQGFKSCEWYSEEHVQMLNTVVEHALNGECDFSNLSNIKSVYFSRRNFGKAISSEFGEGYFQNAFTENGYQAIAPETLSLDQQIFLWNNADQIACINGSIPLNVMFCKNKNLKLTVLNKTSIYHENPIILLKMRKIGAEFVNTYKEPLKNYPKSLGEGPYLLWPTETFEKYCNERKWMSKSPMQIKSYFIRMYISYLWCVLGIVPKARLCISRIIPTEFKNIVHSIRK